MTCNMDCFNCVHDDCINDTLSLAEYQEDTNPVEASRDVKMARIRVNRYARAHKQEAKFRHKKWYNENKDKVNLRARQWQQDNKGRVNAAARERYHRNIEARRQYQREYRARKKAERVS